MNKMIEETEQLRFVIMVAGKTVSIPFITEQAAVQHIANLPQDQQTIAEVVPVTSDNKQLLLG